MIYLLPVIIPVAIMILLMRTGIKKKILIASIIIGAVMYFATISQHGSMYGAFMDGIMNLALWYIIMDVIHRIIYRKRKSTL